MIDPRDLLQEAMKLPPEARAAIAGSLLDSLDTEVDAEAAWSAEIERRLRGIDDETTKLVHWDEVRRRIGL
ncbi:MAG: addiction module protein [Planctomycetota bacterium]